MRRKGFTLVELMVVVAIIAILAAVSIPMYTRFKQKAAASNAVKACMGYTGALQAWYDERGEFTGISAVQGANGWYLQNGAIKVGTSLPLIDAANVTWLVTNATQPAFTLGWSFGASTTCPAAKCDGQYCMTCDDTGCKVEIQFPNDELGLSRAPEGAVC